MSVVKPLRFRAHSKRFAIGRLNGDEAVPETLLKSGWASVTRTQSELSIVAEESRMSGLPQVVGGWGMIELVGPLDLSQTGILARVSGILAASDIPLFCQSTFDTDWFLVPADRLTDAIEALADAGLGQDDTSDSCR